MPMYMLQMDDWRYAVYILIIANWDYCTAIVWCYLIIHIKAWSDMCRMSTIFYIVVLYNYIKIFQLYSYCSSNIIT